MSKSKMDYVAEAYGKYGRNLGIMINLALVYSIVTELIDTKWAVALYLLFEIIDRAIFNNMDKWMEIVTRTLEQHASLISKHIMKMEKPK